MPTLLHGNPFLHSGWRKRSIQLGGIWVPLTCRVGLGSRCEGRRKLPEGERLQGAHHRVGVLTLKSPLWPTYRGWKKGQADTCSHTFSHGLGRQRRGESPLHPPEGSRASCSAAPQMCPVGDSASPRYNSGPSLLPLCPRPQFSHL